jgi:hypothetical protein
MRQEGAIAVHRGPRRRAGKQARASVVDVVDEEAANRVREDVREQQPMGVDDGEPRLAHAEGGGDVAWLEEAEDARKQVVGQGLRVIHDPDANQARLQDLGGPGATYKIGFNFYSNKKTSITKSFV